MPSRIPSLCHFCSVLLQFTECTTTRLAHKSLDRARSDYGQVGSSVLWTKVEADRFRNHDLLFDSTGLPSSSRWRYHVDYFGSAKRPDVRALQDWTRFAKQLVSGDVSIKYVASDEQIKQAFLATLYSHRMGERFRAS